MTVDLAGEGLFGLPLVELVEEVPVVLCGVSVVPLPLPLPLARAAISSYEAIGRLLSSMLNVIRWINLSHRMRALSRFPSVFRRLRFLGILLHCTVSYRIVSSCIVSYRTVSYRIISCTIDQACNHQSIHRMRCHVIDQPISERKVDGEDGD